MLFLVLVAGGYLGSVLLLAFYLQRHGYVFPSLRGATLRPTQTDAAPLIFSRGEQEMIEDASVRYVGQIEPRDAQPAGSVTRAFLSADREVLIIGRSWKDSDGSEQSRLELLSFLQPTGKVMTALGSPSVTARAPFNFAFWLPEPMPALQMFAFHRQAIEATAIHGRPASELTPDVALQRMQEENEAELNHQVRKGFVQRFSDGTWRFTFGANLLTAFKFATPIRKRTRSPQDQLYAFRRRLQRLGHPRGDRTAEEKKFVQPVPDNVG